MGDGEDFDFVFQHPIGDNGAAAIGGGAPFDKLRTGGEVVARCAAFGEVRRRAPLSCLHIRKRCRDRPVLRSIHIRPANRRAPVVARRLSMTSRSFALFMGRAQVGENVGLRQGR